jgi:hypothetical protein
MQGLHDAAATFGYDVPRNLLIVDRSAHCSQQCYPAGTGFGQYILNSNVETRCVIVECDLM